MDENAWCILGYMDIVVAPFKYNHEEQVAEETEDKYNLWNELQDNVYCSPEVAGKNDKQVGMRDTVQGH